MMSGIYTVGAAQETGAAQELNVLPKPCGVRITDTDGRFQIHRGAGVYAENADAMLAAEYLQNYCSEYLGLPLRIVKSKGEAAIHILTDDFGGKARDGQYSLAVTSDGVTIMGAKRSPEACFLGVTTLVQMLPTRAGDIPQLPLVKITDYPRFGYRGMHLDVARHFFPVSFVKKYIDWIALHKLNIFHWHLTDDQGWRIELKSHPELTEKGSYRAGEIKGLFPGEYGECPYQAYYTQDEVKEVIDYAAKRFVTVVPEIDIPGHCMAVLAAHPEFSTTPREGKRAALTWGIYNRQNNVLAPTPEVFSFLDDVFNEVCALFPSKYIHAGGDECAPKWWNESAVAQEFMKKHNTLIHEYSELDELKGKKIFVTVDLDCLDPSVMPGTGTPESGGMQFNELMGWFEYLKNFDIVGADVVELAPDYDASGVSTAVATKVIRELLMVM